MDLATLTTSQNIHENQLPSLGIGRVKWYGGTSRESGKTLAYGFITDGGKKDLFAHVSKLDCNPTDLQEGIHVVFEEHKTKKGREAQSIRILEAEDDHNVLEILLRSDHIPLEFRTRVLLRYSDPLGAGVIKLLVGIVQEIAHNDLDIFNGMDVPISDDDKTRMAMQWPESWLDYELDGEVFSAMPQDFKELACRKHYRVFLEILLSMSNLRKTTIEAREVYAKLGDSDFSLAENWSRNSGDYERARMISARGAELAAKHFYENAGLTVTDTALQQIYGGDDWLTHDLRLNDEIPIDVKNARQNINASVLVEHTVPRFKHDRNSAEVRICGILSPYTSLESIKNANAKGDILLLGETTRSEIDALISHFTKPDHFELVGRYREKLPVWLFNIPNPKGELKRSATTGEAKVKCPEERHWQYLPKSLPSSVIPCCIAAGIDLPKQFEEELPRWERHCIKSLRIAGPPTLGSVYLAILSNFCHALKNMARAEQVSFTPSRYWDLLYVRLPKVFLWEIRGNRSSRQITEASGPLGIVDPLGVVASLISALQLLWDMRVSFKLDGLKTLRVTPEGLVTGRFDNGKTKTILAYCGGKVEGKGKCGYSPLILGKHNSCQICGKLTCPECEFCSTQCDVKKMNYYSPDSI